MVNKLLKTLIVGAITLLPILPVQAGVATYYSDWFHGRRMANGRVFSQHSNSIATNKHRLGTRLKLCYKRRCVIGVVRDRCGGCSYDLSKNLFRQLAPLKKGRIPVRVYKH